MSAVVARKVGELAAAKRALLEELLGRHLSADQQVLIVVVDAEDTPGEAARRQAAAGIRQLFVDARERAANQEFTAEDAGAAVEEAMAQVRRG